MLSASVHRLGQRKLHSPLQPLSRCANNNSCRRHVTKTKAINYRHSHSVHCYSAFQLQGCPEQLSAVWNRFLPSASVHCLGQRELRSLLQFLSRWTLHIHHCYCGNSNNYRTKNYIHESLHYHCHCSFMCRRSGKLRTVRVQLLLTGCVHRLGQRKLCSALQVLPRREHAWC